MAEESFEDEEIADILNTNYIPIKIDREERPDVDAVYMSVCQTVTGSGGWPLTTIMTPDREPFFTGTYFPKKSGYGRAGLAMILQTVAERWREDRSSLTDPAAKLIETAARTRSASGTLPSEPDKRQIHGAFMSLRQSFDKKNGGFGGAPRFPSPQNLMFLLRYHLLEQSLDALNMAETTLKQIMKGGICDHIGGGFSRYSTDSFWLVPHFEKMLYDNAMLVSVLCECYQVTGKAIYREWAEKTLRYIEREMTSPEAAFYSAQDADSGGSEGLYYLFSPEEITEVLGKEDGDWFNAQFDISPEGNFEGRSIPNLLKNPNAFEISDRAAPMLEKLYRYRLGRVSLPKDDKLITSWNALMIAACAKAYRAFGEERYLHAAIRAEEAVSRLLEVDGRLKTSYRMSVAGGEGVLDDYAMLCFACLSLYDASFDVKYLKNARRLAEEAIELFKDTDGGFFMSPADGEKLIFRPKESYDGAAPSGNSVIAYCLCRLSALTGDKRLTDEAARQGRFISALSAEHPLAAVFGLNALMIMLYPGIDLICVLKDEEKLPELKKLFAEKLRPNLNVLVKTPGNAELLSEAAPFTEEYTIPEGVNAAFYVCMGESCMSPVFDLDSLRDILEKVSEE